MSQGKNRNKPSARDVPATYFDLQAYWGVTKHMGGRRATDELIEMCRIDSGSFVLEVGCGVGVTTSILSNRIGCRVVALDRNLMMLSRARDRVRRRGNNERVVFVCAEAECLPFRECIFDAVISESVTTFALERGEAIMEYARVTVSGGRVGINEEVWHEPPTESMESYVGDVLEIPPGIPEVDGWVELFRNAGLSDIIIIPRRFTAFSQFSAELGRYGPVDYLRTLGRFVALIMRNRKFRRHLIHTMLRSIPPGLLRRLGYGLFVGVKGGNTPGKREGDA